jgi:hypothetical protein
VPVSLQHVMAGGERLSAGATTDGILLCPVNRANERKPPMTIARTVDWRLTVTPAEAGSLLSAAFQKVGLNPQSSPGSVVGHSKAKLLKNRWAADVTATIKPYQAGSLVELRIEMPAGTKHYAVADDIAKQVGDDSFDDRGLKAAIDRLSKVSKVGGWLEFRSVRHYLTATETVREIGQGVWGKDQGIVVLTDERLFFFDKQLTGATVEEFPVDAITSVAVRKKLTGEALLITVAGNVTEISRMMHGQGDAITRAFREVKANYRAAASTPAVIHQASSDADELAKFASLRDQGVITEEEFAAKKRQILGL